MDSGVFLMRTGNERVLVTGASGFLGGAVARHLLESGYCVRAFTRPTSPRANLSPEYEIVEGDLCDRDSVRRALEGVDLLFHVAGCYRLWAPDPSDLLRSNVEGVRIVMEEALRAGLRKIVHTSSVATLEPISGGVSDETRPMSLTPNLGVYKRSKILGEALVAEMVATAGLPAVIVNPSAPVGPGDIKPTPTGRIVLEAVRGRVPAFVDTGLNVVHVDDVARGHLAAALHGRVGEKYILGGDNVDLAAILAEIAALTGRRPPLFRLPRAPLAPIAAINEALARYTGREPFLNRESLRLSATPMFFDDSKARRELSHTSRPYRAAIADAVAWFQRMDAKTARR
jgi:dihydroflavonol-4-reductase